MKLLDLDAVFITWNLENGKLGIGRAVAINDAEGIMFQCPKCAEGKPFAEVFARGAVAGDGVVRRVVEGAHRVLCWFSNPANGRCAPREVDSGSSNHPRWMVSGSSLVNLSLTPSVSLAVPGNPGGCGWHGWVTNGDAR